MVNAYLGSVVAVGVILDLGHPVEPDQSLPERLVAQSVVQVQEQTLSQGIIALKYIVIPERGQAFQLGYVVGVFAKVIGSFQRLAGASVFGD